MKIWVRLVAGLVATGVGAGHVGVGWGQDSMSQNRDMGHPAPAGKRAMTFQDLMALKRVSDPQISASGKWVMFSVMDVDLGRNTKTTHLWVVPLGDTTAGPSTALRSAQDDNSRGGGGTEADSSAALRNDGAAATKADSSAALRNDKPKTGNDKRERQLTAGAANETGGRFSPDGKWVFYTSDVGGSSQVWLAPWDEAKGDLGSPRSPLTAISTEADGGVWSPDSKRVMFVSSVYPECSVMVLHPTHDGEAVMNGAPRGGGGTKATTEILTGGQNDGLPGLVGVSGTRVVAAWGGAEAPSWAEEEACNKAKDEAAAKSPVKGQVWEGLLYRHWNAYTGAKRSHVLVVDVDGKNMRDLTPASAVGDAETPTFSLGGPLGYAWAPDSKEIAYVTNLDKVPAASTNNDVFTLRLDEAGAKAVKVSTSPGSDDGPAYSPDGKWLAFRSQARGGFESDKFRLMVMAREKKTITQLMSKVIAKSGPLMGVPAFDLWIDEFTWTHDGKYILFVSGEKGQAPIYRVNVEGTDLHRLGKARGEWGEIAETPDQAIIGSLVRADHPTEIAYAAQQDIDDTTRTFSVDFTRQGPAPETTTLQVEPRRLSRVDEALLSQLDLPKIESFWFMGAEGTKVQGFILRPPGFDPAKKYPVKFLMHGGPQTAWGDAWSYRWNWQLMAANGYVVIGINRRGSTGYGQKFVDEVSGDWGGRAYEDLMKGLDYAETHYSFIDKTRECALGASYGGYMANWVLTHTNRFRCIVTHDGMYDPVSAWGNTEEMWFNEWEFRRPEDFPKGWDGFSAGYQPMGHPSDPTHRDRAAMNGAPGVMNGASVRKADSSAALRNDKQYALRNDKENALRNDKENALRNDKENALRNDKENARRNDKQEGGHPAEPWRYQNLAADQDPFRKWSPMRFIENAKTPTLVIHSQKDYRLDVSQGFELYTALQRRGVPSKMLYFPDEGHWVLKPQNSQLWNEVVGDWCDRWTKTGKYAE